MEPGGNGLEYPPDGSAGRLRTRLRRSIRRRIVRRRFGSIPTNPSCRCQSDRLLVVGAVIEVADVVVVALIGKVALVDHVHEAADAQAKQGDHSVD